MTNEQWNTTLYKQMFAEQEQFRDWLLAQPPQEILNHAYEYVMREDILLSLEYNDLTDAQAAALLTSPSPLADVYAEFDKLESSHMEEQNLTSWKAVTWRRFGTASRAGPTLCKLTNWTAP